MRTWLIFSDGACEGEQSKEGTVGAILVNREGELVQYFSERVRSLQSNDAPFICTKGKILSWTKLGSFPLFPYLGMLTSSLQNFLENS